MLKETPKIEKSLTLPKKTTGRVVVKDWGDNPRRSKKFGNYDCPNSIRFGSGAPEIGGSLPLLDTSAQLPTNTKQASALKNFKKRARAKFVTTEVVSRLVKQPSPLENSYKTTLRCSGHLTEASGKLSGLYCGQRWCLVCSRIRTARCIAGYLPTLEAMPNKWFVTLTRRNCAAYRLKDVIRTMIKDAANIHRVLKEKQKLRYSSLRKIECTYSEKRRDFHPHFHFIFSSEASARAFLAAWLRRYPDLLPTGRKNPNGASLVGQDIRPADNNSCLELFKYFTKVISKDPKETDYRIHIKALDTMYIAMRGVRVFQPSGAVKLVSEELEELQAEAIERNQLAAWSWLNSSADWINKETGELLTGYSPSTAVKEIASHIVENDIEGKFNELKPALEVIEGEPLGPFPVRLAVAPDGYAYELTTGGRVLVRVAVTLPEVSTKSASPPVVSNFPVLTAYKTRLGTQFPIP